VRDDPGDDIINLLLRHGTAWKIQAPVGLSKVGAAHDDARSQALITDQLQEIRIND
jgi:hypothetical protein